LAVNGSEFFTQDTEDLIITTGSAEVVEVEAAAKNHFDTAAGRSTQPQAFEDSILAGEGRNGAAHDSASVGQARKELVDACASLCRSLKACGHGAFKDKESIVKHLQQTAEARKWQAGVEPRQLKGLSDLSLNLLTEYAAILEGELEAVKRRSRETATEDPIF